MDTNLITPTQSGQTDSGTQNGYAMMSQEISPMEDNKTNISGSVSPPTPPPGNSWFSSHRKQLIIGALAVLLIGNLSLSAFLFKRVGNYNSLSSVGLKKVAASTDTFNGDNTLYINTKNKGVGV